MLDVKDFQDICNDYYLEFIKDKGFTITVYGGNCLIALNGLLDIPDLPISYNARFNIRDIKEDLYPFIEMLSMSYSIRVKIGDGDTGNILVSNVEDFLNDDIVIKNCYGISIELNVFGYTICNMEDNVLRLCVCCVKINQNIDLNTKNKNYD